MTTQPDIVERLRVRYICTAGFTREIYMEADRALDLIAAAEIERLRQRVAELEADAARYRWQPIETAPKDGTRILVWSEIGECCEVARWFVDLFGEAYWACQSQDHFGFGVLCSHWMPLPQQPVIDAARNKA